VEAASREHARLQEIREQGVPWRRWGPYLSERQWGTVREDYSANGDAWNYFTHDQARSRAYRWGEDGIGGICDEAMQLCFALAFWNEQDPILKERMFGLTNSEGNHGEDVKEYYFYLDSTPTHSYMRALYKYPQAAYPYEDLVGTNGKRGRQELEYELLETGRSPGAHKRREPGGAARAAASSSSPLVSQYLVAIARAAARAAFRRSIISARDPGVSSPTRRLLPVLFVGG
jgi:hypothetical protein